MEKSLGEHITDIEKKLLPSKYINATTNVYFSSLEYEKYHRWTPLDEVKDYFIDVDQNVEWPPYYVVSEGEFSDNPQINQEAEETLNIYFALIKDYCDAVVNYAHAFIFPKPNRAELRKKAIFLKKCMEAFDLPLMIYGLNGRISHDTFKVDLDLMKLIKSYIDTGVISKEDMEKFDGYPRLYPWAKVEVYNMLHNAYLNLVKAKQTGITK